MITIHEANAADFSTLGLGALSPTECMIEESAGGLYELTLTQPIADDMKYTLIAQGRILNLPAPMRETPFVEIGQSGAVTRRIYKVTTDGRRLNMRTAADQGARVIRAYRPGTEVIVTGTSGSWSSVIIAEGGASGWMWTANLTFVREESESISGDTPGAVIQPRQTREQLFRICEAETDSERRTLTVRAQHISYDLKGTIVAREYTPEDESAEAVCTAMMSYADHETPFRIICTVTDKITIDCTGRSLLDIIMDPDSGILAQTGARLIRDNYDLFILPAEERERGVSLRYGKNLLSACLRTDTSRLITRIQPAGRTKDGETLLISDDPAQSFMDSARIGQYPAIYAKRVEYDVVEGKDLSRAEARKALREKAQADFDAGCDLPDVRLDTEFVRLDLAEDYKNLANAWALHLYDVVPVTDEDAGIAACARMTGYKYDALLDRYDSTTLGELDDADVTVYGYELAAGSVSGAKIIPNSVSGDRLRNLTVSYAKISRATVTQLTADSLTAVKAEISRLAAGEITTDQLYADLAKIAAAQITAANIEKADINWADIKSLTTEIADIANANIGTAKIDWAKIYDLTTDTAIITEGEAGQLYIARLNVTEANMVNLTVGELLLKASDGSFKRLSVDADGNVSAETVTVEGGNIAESTISGGKLIENTITARELNVEAIFADTALIRAIKAANIDVGDLFAAEATIGALDSWLIKAETIAALEGKLDIWASEKIRIAVSAVQVGGTNLITLGNQSLVNAGGSAAVYLGKDWYRASEHQTTVSPYSGVCWYSCPNIEIAAGRKYTLSYYAWIQPGAAAGAVKFRPNLWGGTSDTDKYLTDFIPFVIGTPTRYTITFDTTGWPTGAYTLRFVMMEGQTHEVYFTDVKLEEGTKATAWSPNPNEVRIGSSILMDVNHTEIKTPYLDIDVSGTDGDLHIDENGLSADTATFNHINCGEVVKYYTGASSVTLGAGSDVTAISNALCNRMLTYDVTITLTGDVSGALILKGLCGSGNVTIRGGNHTLNGYVLLSNNVCAVSIEGLKISKTSDNRQCVNIDRCTDVKLYGCVFNANSTPSNAQGVCATYSGVFLHNCEFYNIPDSAMAFSYGTDALVLGCKGAATYCFWYDGATLRVAGSRPSGTCAGGNPSFLLPSDPSTITVDTGSATPAETPVTTASFTANVTGTYYPSGHWINDNVIRQGHEGTGSNGRRDYGCMWFDASALSGKTIKSATLTLKRVAGKGRSGTVALKLWTTTLSGKSGKPTDSLTSVGDIGTIANGETLTVSVPVSAISAIASGGGFVLYTEETANASGKTYSRNYAHFEGTDGSTPVLTVTYQ